MNDVRRVIMKFEDGHTSAGYIDLDTVTQETIGDSLAHSCTVTTSPLEAGAPDAEG